MEVAQGQVLYYITIGLSILVFIAVIKFIIWPFARFLSHYYREEGHR